MDFGAEYLELRSWLIHHPEAILFGVFLVSLIEAVAVVGVIIPAVPLLFVLCVLAAHADASLTALFVAGIAGAMLGDGVSYALGKEFKYRIHTLWPFSRYPDWLQRSEDFVEKHGGKGIIFGRFVGPLRAFVPLAAGIFRMKPLYFLWMNFLSALVWAPFHLLPGYSLGAAAAHDWLPGRPQLLFVAALLIAVAVLTWLLPLLEGRRHRLAALAPRPNTGLFWSQDGRPEDQRAALQLLGLALAGFALLALLLPWLKPLDLQLSRAIHDLRQASLDPVFTAFTLLGGRLGLELFGLVFGGWLLLRREWPLLGLVLVVTLLGFAVPDLLKLAFALPRPPWWAPSGSYGFPSGHAFNAVLVWGTVLVVLARYGSEGVTAVARPLLLTLMFFTIASRPYLGAHWVSDVVGGALLGLACLAALRWSWYRRPAPLAPLLELLVVLILALLVSLGVAVLPPLAQPDYPPLPASAETSPGP